MSKAGKKRNQDAAQRQRIKAFWNTFMTQVPLYDPYAELWEDMGIYPFEAWFYIGGRNFLMEQMRVGKELNLVEWFDEVMKLDFDTALLNHRMLVYAFGYEVDGSVSPTAGMQTETPKTLLAQNRHLFKTEKAATMNKLGASRVQQLKAVDAVFYDLFVKED